jgi:hypothetical protein
LQLGVLASIKKQKNVAFTYICAICIVMMVIAQDIFEALETNN